MEKLILKNGNIAQIDSIRFAYNKCIFEFTIYQKNGFWEEKISDSFSIGYYNSIQEFILNNY